LEQRPGTFRWCQSLEKVFKVRIILCRNATEVQNPLGSLLRSKAMLSISGREGSVSAASISSASAAPKRGLIVMIEVSSA
jgi:hypothetical protein